MSETEKMYENAGIEQTQDITCGDCEFVNYLEEDKPCNACTQYGIKRYPPFTAEKLINLVMFLINKGDFDIKKGSVDITFESFTSCIAGLINNLWQDLTEEEKQQVKEILNG